MAYFIQTRFTQKYTYDTTPFAATAPTLSRSHTAPTSLSAQFASRYDSKQVSFYGFRYYDAETGRWLSRDPIGERGGLNLYGMVGNNPISRWDYLGLSDGEVFKEGITAELSKEAIRGLVGEDCFCIIDLLNFEKVLFNIKGGQGYEDDYWEKQMEKDRESIETLLFWVPTNPSNIPSVIVHYMGKLAGTPDEATIINVSYDSLKLTSIL